MLSRFRIRHTVTYLDWKFACCVFLVSFQTQTANFIRKNWNWLQNRSCLCWSWKHIHSDIPLKVPTPAQLMCIFDVTGSFLVISIRSGQILIKQRTLIVRTYNSLYDFRSLVFILTTERHTTTSKFEHISLSESRVWCQTYPRRTSTWTEENLILVFPPVPF